MGASSFRCFGCFEMSSRGSILMPRDAATIGSGLAHGRIYEDFSSSPYKQNFADLAAAQMEPASGSSDPSSYVGTNLLEAENQSGPRGCRSIFLFPVYYGVFFGSSSARMRRQQVASRTCKIVQVLHTSSRDGVIQFACNTTGVTAPWDLVGIIMGDEITAGAVTQNLAIWNHPIRMQHHRRDRAMGLCRHYHGGRVHCRYSEPTSRKGSQRVGRDWAYRYMVREKLCGAELQ